MAQSAVYPGSFDPITNGHIDIISRASSLFDKVIVAVTQNHYKPPFIPQADRLSLAQESLATFSNVQVKSFDTLLVNFAKKEGVRIIIRGLRAVSDFEYEFQLAGMNKKLDSHIETLFITPAEQYSNISSSLVREIVSLGGDIANFVPAGVNDFLKKYVK